MDLRRAALVWVACLAALAAACRGCAGREDTGPACRDCAGHEEMAAEGSVSGIIFNDLVLRGSVIGEKDEADRYLSTVKFAVFSAPKGTYRLGCNGVLVASNLVLTAAHCVCALSRGDTSRFDGSECATKAKVHVDYWDHSVDGGPISGWEDTRIGDILIHPRFQIVLDSQEAVVTSRADLAIIRLERPVPPEIEPVRLATEDVQVGEVLSVVGLGYDDTGYNGYRYRWFSREKAQAPAGEDRFLFGPMDEADYKGDTGGPCLRETNRGLELVGISQRGLGRTPTCTRIAPYREWLEEQIRVAGGKP